MELTNSPFDRDGNQPQNRSSTQDRGHPDPQNFLQHILDNTSDMILVLDRNGSLVSGNNRVRELLGYRWKALRKKSISQYTDNPEDFERMLASSREKSGPIRGKAAFRHRNEELVYFDIRMIGLSDLHEKTRTLVICRDITFSKRLQSDLIRVDRLAEVGRIALNIAHQINNPLAVINEIIGWTGTVVSESDGISPEDRQELGEAMQRIGEQTARCKTLTHQLLGFARESEPQKTSVDVNKVLNQAVSLLDAELKHKNVQLVFNCEEIKPVSSDAEMLQQVFVNLISNAVDAVEKKETEPGKIELKTAMGQSNVDVTVSDNGIGIEEKDQPKIFELFYTTKPTGKGTGLGITICRNIVQKLGGSIDLKSEAGKGTQFTVRRPCS